MEDSFLHFVKYDLQIVALSWLALAYAYKVYRLLRLPGPREVAPARGSQREGIGLSFAQISRPGSMSSTSQHPWRWLEFAVYHLGALAAITATFTIPFAPFLMIPPVNLLFASLVAGGFVAGLSKLHRRITRPEIRLVSTPDDYFALAGVQVFFCFTIMALLTGARGWLVAYFLTTAAFLFYVPFSKISHYVQWFFARAFFGLRYGRRGIIGSRKVA